MGETVGATKGTVVRAYSEAGIGRGSLAGREDRLGKPQCVQSKAASFLNCAAHLSLEAQAGLPSACAQVSLRLFASSENKLADVMPPCSWTMERRKGKQRVEQAQLFVFVTREAPGANPAHVP